MAGSKEALVIILDIGPTMWEGFVNEESPFDKAKLCISMILQRKIFSESKDEISLVVFGGSRTENRLADPNTKQYLGIYVVQDLCPVNWKLLQYVEKLKPTSTPGDFIDALVVGMDILANQTKGQKFALLRILLFSTFGSEFSSDQIGTIINGLKQVNIQLTIIGPHLGDPELSQGKIKSEQEKEGQRVVQQILDQVDGESYTYSEAASGLIYYQKKKVKPMPWNALLQIGGDFSLPFTGYVSVKSFKPKSAKNVPAQDPLSSLVRNTTFHLQDEDQTEVPKENTIFGFRYGTTLVPINEADKANMQYESGEKGLKLLGFTKKENIKQHYMIGGQTMRLVAQDKIKGASEAFASLVHALYEANMVAIVRYVYSGRSHPKIGVLSPLIKSTYQCLIFIQLPFMEDIRHFPFSSLSKYQPSEEQLAAIDELITEMDLTPKAEDEDSEELLKSKNTVNPYVQRLYQCLQYRAFHKDGPLPDVPPHVAKVLECPKEVEPKLVGRLQELFPLQEVTGKKGAKTAANYFQNSTSATTDSGIDIQAQGDVTIKDLLANSIKEVGTVNPAEDFRSLISQPGFNFADVSEQLGKIILRLIEDSLGAPKIISALVAWREESIKVDQSSSFNNFLKDFKVLLLKKNLQLWKTISKEELTLIHKEECPSSDITKVESSQFIQEQQPQTSNTDPDMEIDDEDIFKEL